MKIKKIIAIFMIALCSVIMFACEDVFTNGFAKTDLGIYDLYYDYMLKTEDFAKSEAATARTRNADDNSKITRVTTVLGNVAQEEVAIIASVECCSATGVKKESFMQYKNGIIHVNQTSVYVCEVEDKTYDFNIIKDSNGVYVVTYKKGDYNCNSRVTFDKDNGRLQIDISTYDEEGTQLITSKNFYLLNGGFTALKANVTSGKNNLRAKYELDIYREIVDYTMKISKIDELLKY